MCKKISITFFLFAFAFIANAQQVKFAGIDKSPLDVLYYPVNTTKVKDTNPIMRVLYSRPQKNGREIFGVLEQFGKVWRLGANESTELEVFKTIALDSKKIKPGRYSLFAIPEKDKWTLIVNKNTDKWGAFAYDSTQDILRITVPIEKPAQTIEALSMTFKDVDNGTNLIIAWDNTQVAIPFTFVK